MVGCGMALSSMYIASQYEAELAKRLNLREMYSQPRHNYYKCEDGHPTILVGY